METHNEEFFLNDHNLECYILERMHQRLHFINKFPFHDNKTGEFTSLAVDASAEKDIEDGIMGEPLSLTEGVEFTEITMSDYTPKRGSTSAKGYRISYTDLLVRQARLSSTLPIRLSKAVSGFVGFYDKRIFNTLCSEAGVSGPTLSDWSDPDLIDPEIDNLSIQEAFDDDRFGYQVTDVYLNSKEYYPLAKYIASDKENYDLRQMELGQVRYHNLLGAIPQGKYLAMDENIPAGVIEKYVNPAYSTVRQMELDALKAGDELKDVPPSLINLNSYVDPKKPDKTHINIWAEMAMNVQEPNSLIYGSFGSN